MEEPLFFSSRPIAASKLPGETERMRAPFAPNRAAIRREYQMTKALHEGVRGAASAGLRSALAESFALKPPGSVSARPKVRLGKKEPEG